MVAFDQMYIPVLHSLVSSKGYGLAPQTRRAWWSLQKRVAEPKIGEGRKLKQRKKEVLFYYGMGLMTMKSVRGQHSTVNHGSNGI